MVECVSQELTSVSGIVIKYRLQKSELKILGFLLVDFMVYFCQDRHKGDGI